MVLQVRILILSVEYWLLNIDIDNIEYQDIDTIININCQNQSIENINKGFLYNFGAPPSLWKWRIWHLFLLFFFLPLPAYLWQLWRIFICTPMHQLPIHPCHWRSSFDAVLFLRPHSKCVLFLIPSTFKSCGGDVILPFHPVTPFLQPKIYGAEGQGMSKAVVEANYSYNIDSAGCGGFQNWPSLPFLLTLLHLLSLCTSFKGVIKTNIL